MLTIHAEHTYNLVMPGLDGLRDMAKLMKSLREHPPAEGGKQSAASALKSSRGSPEQP